MEFYMKLVPYICVFYCIVSTRYLEEYNCSNSWYNVIIRNGEDTRISSSLVIEEEELIHQFIHQFPIQKKEKNIIHDNK